MLHKSMKTSYSEACECTKMVKVKNEDEGKAAKTRTDMLFYFVISGLAGDFGFLHRTCGYYSHVGTVGILEMVGVRSPRFKVLSVLLSSCQPLSTTFLILIISFLSHVVYSKPGMILASLLTVVLAASFIGTTAQQVPIVYDSIHNATDLQGTWSSGAQNVVTGPVSFLMIQTSFT